MCIYIIYTSYMHSIYIDSTYMITDKNINRAEGKHRRKMLSENPDKGPRSLSLNSLVFSVPNRKSEANVNAVCSSAVE